MDKSHSTKNQGLSPAANELGLGTELEQQVADIVKAHQDPTLNATGAFMGAYGQTGQTMSPAAQALLKQAGGGIG